MLTHGKANNAPSHESNQNRFRIYFESPAEADRIPQALRRNPYKRWRRASSSVAPSRHGDDAEREHKDEVGADKAETPKATPSKLPEVAEECETPSAAPADTENDNENNDTVAQPADEEVAQPKPEPESSVKDPSSEDMILTDPAVPTSDAPAPSTDDDAGAEAAVSVEAANGEVPAQTSDAEETDELESSPAPADVTATNGDTVDSSTAEVVDPATTAEATQEVETEEPAADAPAPVEGETESNSVPADAPASAQPVPASTSTAPAAATTDAELSVALAQSAENTASAYKTRTRRRSSVSSTDSRETAHPFQPEVTPSMNRLSILYEGSQRRMCFDAEVVDKIRVFRAEGRIEVLFKAQQDDDKEAEVIGEGDTLLPKGYLVCLYGISSGL